LHPYILFEEYIYILASKMASPGNQRCANCIGTLSITQRYLPPGGEDILAPLQPKLTLDLANPEGCKQKPIWPN